MTGHSEALYTMSHEGGLMCKLDRITMRIITLTPTISSVETKEGVARTCSGVAQVCISVCYFQGFIQGLYYSYLPTEFPYA